MGCGWRCRARTRDGYSPPTDPAVLVIRGNLLIEKHRHRVIRQSLFKLVPNQNPKAFDLMTLVDGEFWLTTAIFMIEDDTLTICEGGRDRDRPTAFRHWGVVDDDLTLLRSFKWINKSQTTSRSGDAVSEQNYTDGGVDGLNVISASAAGASAHGGLDGGRVARSPNAGEVALDVCGGRDKVYLQETIDSMNINLLWSMRPVGEYVMFVSKVDEMALDANGGSGNPYPRSADANNINHLWLLAKTGGDYMIWSAVSNVVLDANGGRGRPYLSASPDPRNINHRWELRSVGNYYMLIPRSSSFRCR